MTNEEVALKVDRIYKDFLLPHEKADSIKSAFLGILKGKRGRTIEKQHALKNISINIKKGEFFGIVGRNGSGKSTLLKILAGIYQPTKGKVYTNGRLVPFIELGVGFNPELTGRENVYLSASLLGFSQREVDRMYKSIVEFAELEKFMDQKLKNYSSGMQVRLAFSVAVRADADILLIDEVLAVGDADFQRKCFDYFKKLKKDKKTVVFVSHDMGAIREYCDEVVLIEDSVMVAQGTADKIASQYTKLFNKQISSDSESSSDRWGDGLVVTKNVKANIEIDTITLEQEIVAKHDVDNPIVGFRIRDLAGKEILGTNTKIEDYKLGLMKKGVTKKITWRFTNIISAGNYMIDVQILHENQVTVSDWWDNARKIHINREKSVPYAVYLEYDVK